MDQKAIAQLLDGLAGRCSDLMVGGPGGVAWHDDVQRGDFAAALTLIEQHLNENPDCAGTKLWWVRCQLELNRLPISAVSGPLEEIQPRLRDMPALYALACWTFLKSAVVLFERSQSRLAVSMAEKAVDFAGRGEMLDADEEQALDGFYRSCLDEEIRRAHQRRENKRYIEGLEEKRKLLSEKPKPAKKKAVKPAARAAKRSELLSAKSIIAGAAETRTDDGFVLGIPGTESIKQAGAMPESGSPDGDSAVSPRGRRSLLGALFIIVLLTCGVAAFWLRGIPGTRHSLAAAPAMEVHVPAALAMDFPNLTYSTGGRQGVNAALDEVGKRLHQLALNKKPEEPKASEAKQQEPPETTRSAKPDMGRLPPDELTSISQIPEVENQIPENRLPKPNADRFAKTKVEEVGTSPRKAPVPQPNSGSLRVEKDGRVYGPPRDRDAAAPAEAGKALDGAPLKSYDVEQFNPPLRFRTIVGTDVLSSPSVLAKALARLESNTPIDVTARMGKWLELRSSKGHVGYIYAQDAAEERR